MMQKLTNKLKLLNDFYSRKEEISGLPVELVIETTNKCNLNCVMCTRQKMTRPVGFMSIKLFQKIINEVSAYLELVYLHGLGEPLFHPKIVEMIVYAKSRGIKVGLSTNATVLTPERSRQLLTSGLDYLIISLDAATPGTYLKVRGGKNFPQVVSNVREYLKLKRGIKKSPFTVVQFVRSDFNKSETEKFKKIWQNAGAEVIRVKPMIDLLQKSGKVGKPPHRPCFYLWRQLNMISWDGKFLTPCCMDTDGEYSLGDVNKNSVRSLWNGPKMRFLRRAHTLGQWEKVALCRDCTYPQPSFPGKIGAMVFPDLTIKKILPVLENITLGKFVVYE